MPEAMLPHLTTQFRLEIDDLVLADFAECTGLTTEIGTDEFAEGGENRFTHRFPSRGSMTNLVLKRGMTDSTALWDWYSEVLADGRVQPRDGQVVLLADREGVATPIKAWAFVRAFPVKFSGPDLNAASTAVAIESIELVHHGLTLVPTPG
jgi:phage tail-like protein